MPRHRFCFSGEQGRGEGPAPTVQSSLDVQSSLVRSEDQYVGQGKERPSSSPAVWDTSCIINIHSPKAASPPTQRNPPLKGGREVPAAPRGDAGWMEPGSTPHFQRRLWGGPGAYKETKKFQLLQRPKLHQKLCSEAETGSSYQVFCCCSYPPGAQLTSP